MKNLTLDESQKRALAHNLSKDHQIDTLDIQIDESKITIQKAQNISTWDAAKTIDSLLRAWDIDFHRILITEDNDSDNFEDITLTFDIQSIWA